MKPPTLEQVPILSSTQQYRSEVAYIPELTQEEEAAIVTAAKEGCPHAKTMLIESCLRYVLAIAHRYSVYLKHDDFLDLVQEGNMILLEFVDKALQQAQHPASFIRGIIRLEIRHYCYYKSTLITRPTHCKEQPQVLFLTEEHENLIEVATQEEEIPITQEETLQLIRQLDEPHRTVLLRHTGLDGQQPESLRCLGKRLFPHKEPTAGRHCWNQGVKKVSRILEKNGLYESRVADIQTKRQQEV